MDEKIVTYSQIKKKDMGGTYIISSLSKAKIAEKRIRKGS